MAFAVAEAGLMLLCFLSSSLTFAEPIGIIVLTNSSGVIKSPNFPNNYPNNFNGKWRISPETSHVNISIESFKLEDSSSCKKFDFVQLKARVGYSTRETTWCGFISPRQRTLKVNGRAIEITFRSDASFNTEGFKISYRGYDVDPCVHNNGGCSHNCSLVKGARVCSCPEGYRIMYDKRRCTVSAWICRLLRLFILLNILCLSGCVLTVYTPALIKEGGIDREDLIRGYFVQGFTK
ncbi:Dorsal-ventral patterning tolloid-like protein 1 [Acropora cervicornis]|uniref:Dorsal-ventral patterning tolloid-like protein 1 n=1 Tax=Acropora cervicornis TaxID=6130 RepID=A0AAD9V5T8_ACRCE|nr:Dorsal-ventral patterning tolloid-like protein 1 [Acropora cervicornis]